MRELKERGANVSLGKSRRRSSTGERKVGKCGVWTLEVRTGEQRMQSKGRGK